MICLINVQARRALTAAVWLSILAGVARAQTWTGAISTDWNTAGNWNPSGVPNGDTVVVSFAGSGVGTVNISSSVVETQLTFSNTSFNYTLTSSAGKVLTLDEYDYIDDEGDEIVVPPEINVSAAVTGTETINLANVAGGSLVASTGLVLQNNSTSSGTTLVIGPNTVIGAGSHTVTVAGPGNTQITGSFATGTNQVSLGLTDDGPGTLTFSGNGTNLRGGLGLFGGTLVLDYSSNIATKLGSGSLTLGGGVLSMTANSSTPVTQVISAGTSISAGQTDVQATGSGTITLNAGAIARTHGATADFALASPPTFSVLTSTGLSSGGLLGTGPAFATVNGGSTWATVSGLAVAGLTTYSSIYSANNNVDVTGIPTLSNLTVNSLRFNAASNVTMTLSGTNTLQSGGILVTPASGGGTITGGSLTTSGGGELIVHDYAPSGFTINSALVSTGGLTKTGPRNLILGGNNTGLTGPININRGTLIVTNPAAVNSASAINLNDLRSAAAQSFTVDMGNNTAGTMAPPISVSAFSPTGSGTLFSTGASLNSRVTLAGGIGNDSTTTPTPITFSGDPSNTSGFNVTGDTTALFGSVTISHGFLGISRDAALGDDSNVVMLNIGSATGGGLDFLGGFNGLFSHPITINSTSRVVVDGGATGTISGAVNSAGFGPGWQFVKGGTGTLDFSGDGTAQFGGLTLSGGTLALDYSSNTASKVGTGNLTLNGGVLSFTPNSVTPVTQAIPLSGTVVNSGHTDISATGAGTVTLNAEAITRTVGGTIDVTPSTGALTFSVLTSTGNSSGSLLGTGPAFATVNGGSTWATVSGGAIAGLSTFGANTYSSGTNTDVTSTTVPAAFTTNSLRFNVPNLSLSLSGTNTLQSGGILVTPSAGGDQITGVTATLTVAFAGELLIHQYSSGPFVIGANLSSPAGLTKTGPGPLTLTANNTGLTGPVNINRGSLTLSGNAAAVNSASAINFNDDRNGADLQTFTVVLPNGTNGTIAPPIRLSAESATDYGTYFTTGSTTGSTITLSGVISTVAGLNSSIRFTGPAADTSGFNLTNTNTFTGNISLQHGSLGITAGASLGSAANTLILEVNDTGNGGLVFLNGGVTVAQPVVISALTRLVSNGTDSNTISGSVSGTAGVFKVGTGTLALTNANNTVTGGVNVSAGTLSLGATGALPNGTNVTVAAGATFSPATTNTGSFGTVTLNGGTFQFPSGSGLIDFINQIVTSAAGGTVDLTGTGQVGLGIGTGITVNGNSTWLSPGNLSSLASDSSADVPITIPAGVTLTNGIAVASLNQFGFRIIGGGTLFQNSDATNVVELQAPLTVVQSRYRVTDASSNGGVGNLGIGFFTLDGGTFAYGGTTATTSKAIGLTANGGTIEVESAATVLTDNGAITGAGSLTKIGAGNLLLGSAGNTFSGLTVTAGTVQTTNDNTLGTGTVTVAAPAVVQYTASTTSARTFNLNFGTLAAGSGATVMLNGAAVNGGFMRGPGTFALTGGTALSGVSTAASAIINETGPASVVNFTNNGQFTNAAGQTLNWNNGTNASAGELTIGGTVAANDFVSDGVVTINGGALNGSGSNLVLGGGSRTTINASGALAAAAGTTIELNGGLLVNNGTISGTTDVNYGSLAKGTGVYGIVNVGQGGAYAPGNSPGIVTAAAVNFDNTPVISGAPVLQIELAGTTLGTQYDQLAVTGQASLGGTLALLPLNGFVPVSGDKFVVMTYANRSGTFSSVTGTTPAPGLAYSTVYLPTSLVVLTTTAGDKTWGVDSDGNSSLGSNWIGGVAPGGVGDTATFSTIITAPRTVTLDADTTVGTLKFDSPNNYTIAGPHTLTLQAAGAASAAMNVSNVHGNGAHTISAPITLASDLNIVQNSSGTLRLTGSVNDSAAHTITKSGSGTAEVSGSPTLGANTLIAVNGGTLRFAVTSGSPTLASGVSVAVNGGGTLELAGSVSALSSGSNRVNIVNSSSAPGLLVSGTNQIVGNIGGSGTTQVNAGSDLTANHIIQNSLIIGGTAGTLGLVTIDASDNSGNPLDQASGLALADSLMPSGPFEAGEMGSANFGSGDGTDLEALLAGNLAVGGNSSAVPEPSTLLLALLAVLGVFSAHFARKHIRWQTV